MRLVLLAAALVATACYSGDNMLDAGSPGDVRLRRGHTVEIGPEPLSITFADVLADSRCPIDVVCPWAGDGQIQVGLALGDGPTTTAMLQTNGPSTAVTVGSYTVTLLSLSPDPVSTAPIPPDAYEASLRVHQPEP
jgi:hypothetical protein